MCVFVCISKCLGKGQMMHANKCSPKMLIRVLSLTGASADEWINIHDTSTLKQ